MLVTPRMKTLVLVLVFAAPTPCAAAVFDEAPGAGVDQAYYGNWGTNADATNPAPTSYNNYRKLRDTNGLPVATADDADATSATWSSIYQDAELRAPAMFIGQSPSTTSYENNVLFLGGLFDVGNGGTNGDSAFRHDWGLRIGFLEDPESFVNQRAPNDESWDLWAADWGSDGVSLQFRTGASDNPDASRLSGEVQSDDQYIRFNGNGAVFQAAGTPGDGIADERGREAFGAGIQTSEPTAVNLNGPIEPLQSWVTTGIEYAERLEVKWWMEQNDPNDPESDVTFYAEIGEALFQQSFDPTAVLPNPTNDPENVFTDNFFDWQNATPVFYLGAVGGAVEAVGQMGFTNPNPTTGCDFDGSGTCDIADLDELLYTGLSGGDSKYDLDGSGTVDLADRDAFLREVGSLPGDADLNGVNNANDLNRLGTSWQSPVSSWGDGDFDGDGQAGVSDLNTLGVWWTKTAADFAAAGEPGAAAVPEPTGAALLFVGIFGSFAASRRKRRC